MKKICLTLFAIFAIATSGMAKSIVFTLADGTQVYYMLGGESSPVMKFTDDGKVVVNTDAYELSSIKNFRFSETDDPNGIEQVLAKAEVEYKDNQFVVKSADAKNVKVYSANGTQAKAAISSANGFTTIDLPGLPGGIYIVSVGGSSIKVVKK